MTQVNDNINTNKGKHLTYEERVKIEAYKELGYSNRKISRILGRVPQTINDAVNQGTVRTIKQRQVHNDKVYEYTNTAILLMPIINNIFVIDKIVDAVQNGCNVIHLLPGLMTKC